MHEKYILFYINRKLKHLTKQKVRIMIKLEP